MLLQPSIKNYPWGRLGRESLVAELATNASISETTPYAELWMGAHPSGPSTLSDGTTLLDYIQQNPESLGKSVLNKFGPQLPFLFKVLSVGKGLSIQAHPDIPLAKVLHQRDPANYPDANHKPEMAIAVTPFEVLCGFRSLEEIQEYVREIPELHALVGDVDISNKEGLRKAFANLMTADSASVSANLKELLNRTDLKEHSLLSRLNSQYPGDVGVFCIFFLQHFTLNPGQALFLPANEPHAYLSGDCLECMANSDNVVRAGLTPKFKDVLVLTEMLTFEHGKNWIFKETRLDESRVLYKPPVNEFAVESITGKEDQNLLVHSKDSCSILIVVEGGGTFNENLHLVKGSVIFMPSDTAGSIAVKDSIKLFRAFCPV